MKNCEAYGMSAIISQFFSIEFEYYQSKNVIRRYNAESVTVTGILTKIKGYSLTGGGGCYIIGITV